MKVLYLAVLLAIGHVATPTTCYATEAPVSNAALDYWQAFVLTPKWDGEQEKILSQWDTVPVDAAVQKIVESGNTPLKYLRRGSSMAQCDWGLDYNEGINLLLPHLGKSRDLARLACLRARYAFEHDQPRAGLDDVSATLVLARHVGRETLISLLVQVAIENMAIDAIAKYLPKLDKVALKDFAARLDSLPSGGDLASLVDIEKKFMVGWLIPRLQAEKDHPSGPAQLWDKITGKPQKSSLEEQVPDLDKAIQAAGGIDKAIASLQEANALHDEIKKLISLPPDQLSKSLEAWEKKRQASPMANLTLPNYDKVFEKLNRKKARLAMLRAAVAVSLGGRDELRSVPDPFGGSFEYRELDGGFELRSSLDQPVTLTVGGAK